MDFDDSFAQGILKGISDFQGFRWKAKRQLELGEWADPKCWDDWVDSQGMLVSATFKDNNEKFFVISELHNILSAWSNYDKHLTSGVAFRNLDISIPRGDIYDDSCISDRRKEELGRKAIVNIVRAVRYSKHSNPDDGFGYGYLVNSLVNLRDLINGDVA